LQHFFYQTKLITKFVTKIFPLVSDCLSSWQNRLDDCPDENLRGQALASIKHKRFHAQGGSIYALYPGVPINPLLSFIVAFQTISDYLDNLCDRAQCLDGESFKQLHIALADAVSLNTTEYIPSTPYYKLYPYQDDGGYLLDLVTVCRNQLRQFPNYYLVEKHCLSLVELYSALQTYKHTYPREREKLLEEWIRPKLAHYPEISTWEFAAATGSTLGIFMLVAGSSLLKLDGQAPAQIVEAYFPWICSLHIMLDYLIDQEEDKIEEDFNFVAYYKDKAECCRRMIFLWRKSKEHAQKLPNPTFHLTVIEGLLALYLSDAKALQGNVSAITEALLQEAGSKVRILHRLCLLLRKKSFI
jgi:tetraprenyl-beta-curcumene synthase